MFKFSEARTAAPDMWRRLLRMRVLSSLLVGFIGAIGVVGVVDAAQAASLTGPVPDWVKPLEAPAPLPVVPESEGVQYLLADRQVRVAAGSIASYRHFVQRVQYESQLAESSEISIDFDPSYQRLTLHHVRLRRGEHELDKLRPASIQLLQRERDLESRILDGQKTAHLILEDVRVGDIVDYDYTLEGSNPALANASFSRCELQFSVPVERVRCRLLWPQTRELKTRSFNGAGEGLESRAADGTREIVWERRHQPALKVEDDAPDWFNPYAHVEWGDAKDWAAVVAWALPLYKLPAQLGPELTAEREAIVKATQTPDERVAAALRLVQGKVRYLGIEMGAGSYAPRAPELVFHRRFGDCKDKALLLAALLRSMDIEAWPALVNTRARQELLGVLPSPVQFDHVIVKVKLNARNYWLDPTRASQYGTLDLISQADFRQALVIAPAVDGLEAIARPVDGLNKRRIQVSIDGSGGSDKPAAMTVRSVYTGRVADAFRADLVRQGREELQKLYLNFYVGYYPGVSVAGAMDISDDQQRNEISLVEHYLVPELWHRPKEDKRLQASIFSGELREFLKTSGQPRRSSPLQLVFPMDVEVSSEMRLPRHWGGKRSDAHIAGPGFEYTGTVRWPSADKVVVVESYKSLGDEVSARETQDYNDKIGRVKDALGYTLYDVQQGGSGGAADGSGSGSGGGGVNWPVVLLALILCAGLARAAWSLYRWDPAPSPLADPQGLRGLGGWLIWVGLGLLTRILMELNELLKSLPAYSLSGWNNLTTPGTEHYHALWAPMLLFELAGLASLLTGAALLLLLFLRKRSSFPRLMVGYLWAGALFSCADQLLTRLLPLAQDAKVDLSWFRVLVTTALWSSYLMRSKRVTNTFVETLAVATPEPALAGAELAARGDGKPQPNHML